MRDLTQRGIAGLFRRGIVRLFRDDGSDQGKTLGTAFVAHVNGLLVTCAHVLEKEPGVPDGSSPVNFEFASGQKGTAKVVPEYWRASNAQDVAVLKVEQTFTISDATDVVFEAGPTDVADDRPVALPLGYSAHLRDREEDVTRPRVLSTFGYPRKTREGLPGLCEVVGQTKDNTFDVYTVRSNEVSYGFSGATVWDEDLKAIVGVAVSIVTPGADLAGRQTETAFFIPIETIRNACPCFALPKAEPYRELEAFEEKHAAFYFGRDAESTKLADRIVSHDFVSVIGVSGSGKSSLVRAGLVKGLKAIKSDLVGRIRVRFFAGSDPLLALMNALEQQVPNAPRPLTELLEMTLPPGGSPADESDQIYGKTVEQLAEGLRAFAKSNPLIIVCDQFERLYTECEDERLRDRFASVLVKSACRDLKVVIAVRADYYGRVLNQEGLGEAVCKDDKKAQITLLFMGEDELRAAICEPARSLFRHFEPGVVDRMIQEVHGRAGDLPLLQFALTDLWASDHSKGILTNQSYEKLGYDNLAQGVHIPGVRGAIVRRAEGSFEALQDAAEQIRCERLFCLLVDTNAGSSAGQDISRRALAAELDEETRALADHLADTFLLTTDKDQRGQRTYEVAHEALIRFWPRLQSWVEKQRSFSFWYQTTLFPSFQQWLAHERSADLYLRSKVVLSEAQDWLAKEGGDRGSEVHRYVSDSLQAAERDARLKRMSYVA